MSDTNVHRVVGNLLVGTSHFFVDTTTNQVGVNTSTPSAALDVASGDLKVGSDITIGNSGTITAANFSGNGSGLTQVNSDQGSWVNGASSNIHLAVSTDKVGIGTVDPSNSLHIYRAAGEGTSGLLIEKASGDPGTKAALFFGVNNTDENPGVAKAAIFYERNLVNGRGDIKFCNDAANDANPVTTEAVDTRMIIKNSGEVGVGTVSPQTLLHVAGNGQTSTGGIIRAQLDDPGGAPYESNAFTMRMGGYSHSIRMDLNTLRLNAYGDAGTYGAMQFVVGDGTGSGNGQVTAMTIGTGGQVGIGRSDPACALDIAGEDVMIRGSTPSLNFSEGTNGMDGAFRIHYDGATQNDGNNFLAIQYGTNFTGTSLHCTLTGNVGVGTSAPGSILDVHGASGAAIKKSAPTASTGTYSFILNGPRPGTTSSGATHFINGSTRNDDGGASTYTIRNDSGQLRLGHGSYTTVFDGNHLRMAQGDNSYFHFGPNGTWSGELYVGATSDRSTSAFKAQCISTNGNLHLDAGDTRSTYINHYSGSSVVLKHYIVSGRPLAVVGKNNLGSAGQASGVFNFNTALINSGIYNTSNGRFTIPSDYPGYYLVAFVGLGAYYNTNQPNTRWYHNGSVHGYGAYHTNLSGMSGTPAHVGVSGSHVLYLGANDYIDLRIVGGTLYGQSTLHAYATVMYLGA